MIPSSSPFASSSTPTVLLDLKATKNCALFDGETLPERAEIHSREGPGKCCHYFISHFPSEKLAPEDARDEGKGGHPSGDTRDVGSEGEAR